jgi:predicted deacylase
VPRANELALQANTRLTPNQPEADGNLNRNVPRLEQGGVVPRGELAKAFWSFSVRVIRGAALKRSCTHPAIPWRNGSS